MPKRKANHYEALGVDQKATTEEIKKAYRKKARNHHPDIGGNEDEMAKINAAYTCLSNPQRRQLYDATGQDNLTSLEQDIRSLLLEGFKALIDDGFVDFHLHHVKDFVRGRLREAEETKRKFAARRLKYASRRDAIKSKTETNLFQMLIDQELQQIDGKMGWVNHGIEICKGALKELENYQQLSAMINDKPYFGEITITIGTFR